MYILQHFVEYYASLQFQVTADGSLNCADNPGEQEATVAHLLYCETVSALLLLKAGGSFVLKTFTTFECHTLCLLYLLACCFSEVKISIKSGG